MRRPCACDRTPPAGSPWAPGYCRPCWLFHNDPRYAALWDGPPRPWPRWALALAAQRQPGEAGVGDTLARKLGKPGKTFKVAYRKLMRGDCGCDARQARMNADYPYPPPGSAEKRDLQRHAEGDQGEKYEQRDA